MGIANLASPWAKFRRANEHLDLIESELLALNQQNTKAVPVTFRHDGPWLVIYVGPSPILPVRLALIAGDCLNNLRATLDHLVWQLVLREDHEPQQTNCFPICETAQQFRNKCETPAQRGNPHHPLHGIPIDGDAWAIVEKAQPFNRPQPQGDALTWLANLSNIDKHRTLLVQMSFIDHVSMQDKIHWITECQPIERKFAADVRLSREHPTEIARFRFASESNPRMDMERDIIVDPTLGDGKTQLSFGVIDVARLRIKEILNEVAALPGVK